MDISYLRIYKALFIFSLGLVSCSPARFVPDETQTEVVFETPSPTLQPYWGLDPSLPDPVGGWQTYRAEELNLTFEYPSVYEQGRCGEIFLVEKIVEDNEYHLIGYGSSIRISIFTKWDSKLDEITITGQLPSDLVLLTDLETFSLDGEPAFRHIYRITQEPNAFEYAKTAWTYYRGKLYWFSYLAITDLPRCNAPPISEDAVYEHMLSTVEFIK
jgi:hypothetical protein